MSIQKLKRKKAKHITKINNLVNIYLNKLLLNDFDKQDVLIYQRSLNDFIELNYNFDDFSLFKKSPKSFLENAGTFKIVNVLSLQLCFNINDLLSFYLDNFKLFSKQKLLAEIITKEILIKLDIFNNNIKKIFKGEYIHYDE